MIVKYLGSNLTVEVKKKYDLVYNLNQDYHLDIDQNYLVVALIIKKNGAIILHCINKYGHIGYYPFDFFQIVESKVSKYWFIGNNSHGDITFLPKEYYENEYFHDDLSEDDSETVRKFHDLVKRLRAEHE
jgi:hypothetical protein